MGERRRDAVDARALHDRARQDVLGVDGALQRVVLLGEDPREHGLGDRDERDRIRHLEHGERSLLRRADERPRHLVVGEPEPEPEPGEAGVGQTLDVGALLRGVAPTPIPVVSSSSPPFSHGVGSSSSLTWTHRIGLSVSPSPATRRSAIPGIARMSRTVTAMADCTGRTRSTPIPATIAPGAGRFVQGRAARCVGRRT